MPLNSNVNQEVVLVGCINNTPEKRVGDILMVKFGKGVECVQYLHALKEPAEKQFCMYHIFYEGAGVAQSV
jgi:hypothetical protein